ncbi:YwhD family protein [Calidifontibacillus erzurumensis]|uniref:YwhD family protein n=1 Tax=Calidifontibacillus erzurumensis TaxID=2741433 RepID=A0A8J8GIJ1_9BACI|nr:YwhD family protein [Calidifontibacillus erzurumensis]NSL52985.1 YwhD family protein [Calidifontibacillus erzurumensis]
MNKNQRPGFNIIKNDSTMGHGGFGTGSISLNNVSPVIIDTEKQEVFIDMGALHARSEIEKGNKIVKDRSEVPNGKTYWVVWVTVNRNEKGPYYHGLGACELFIDHEAKRLYKSMPEHVNNMDRSLKGRIVVNHMDDKSRKSLGEFLKNFNADMWANSSEELRQSLFGAEG